MQELTYSLMTNFNEYTNDELNEFLFDKIISSFNPDEWDFIVLSPSKPIKDSIFIQAGAPEKAVNSEFVLEIGFNNEISGLALYRFYTKDKNIVLQYFIDYWKEQKIPDIFSWEDVSEEVKRANNKKGKSKNNINGGYEMGAKAIEWLVGIIFAIIGAVFLTVGIVVAKLGAEFRSYAEEGMAVITDIERYKDSDGESKYEVYVAYTVNGREYEQELNYYSSDMYEGKEVKIYYDPNSPHKIQAEGAGILELIFIGLGGLFFILGLFMIFIKVYKRAGKRKLLETGQRVHAGIEEVRLNTSYSVNGRHPFVIILKWTDPATGMVHLFKSEHLWSDPKPLIEERNIQSLPVYINSKNPKQYVVSLEPIQVSLGSV